MSFYARMEGEIQYPNTQTFWKMYKILRQGFWIDPEGYFLDEAGSRLSEKPNIDFDQKIIHIPHASHRNLAHVDFFLSQTTGKIIGTSCDGCFIGWITTPKIDQHFDLMTWANSELNEIPPNPETEFDDFCEWQCEVENDFFDWCNGDLKIK